MYSLLCLTIPGFGPVLRGEQANDGQEDKRLRAFLVGLHDGGEAALLLFPGPLPHLRLGARALDGAPRPKQDGGPVLGPSRQQTRAPLHATHHLHHGHAADDGREKSVR